MGKIIIYDYEVFKYDTLLGCTVIDENKEESLFQTWNLDEIRTFYNDHKDDIWVGHNNYKYDDYITEAIANKKNPYLTSQKIIKGEFLGKLKIKLLSIDLMKLTSDSYSLKLTELLCGKQIHESEISFDIDRPLTSEEKKEIEIYNQDDLDQTTYNFKKMFDLIKLRLDIIKEFKLNLEYNLKAPGFILAANILDAKHNASLQYMKRKPIHYPSLIINNSKVLDYYMSEKYREKDEFVVKSCSLDIKLSGFGGSHSLSKKEFVQKVKYIDVSGYYNLIAILYDLLPRNLSKEAKEKYKQMYYEQLALKKTNPVKREAYKVILLAVIGSMDKEDSPFYDPESYKLLTILGKLFIYDLAEKLDGLVRLIQVNTDGIMLEPLDWTKEKEIDNIINAWVERTGFTVKNEYLYRLWQRDVNCYCCADDKNNIIYKGDILKNYDIGDKAYASQKFFKSKEPPIIAQGIIRFLMYDTLPEEYVIKNKKNLKLFQYACQKNGADYLTYDTFNLSTYERNTEKLQGVDRVFALKSNKVSGMVFKHKDKFGKHSISKYPSLPDNVFVYNDSLENAYDKIGNDIDYQYYIDRIYEKIRDFT